MQTLNEDSEQKNTTWAEEAGVSTAVSKSVDTCVCTVRVCVCVLPPPTSTRGRTLTCSQDPWLVLKNHAMQRKHGCRGGMLFCRCPTPQTRRPLFPPFPWTDRRTWGLTDTTPREQRRLCLPVCCFAHRSTDLPRRAFCRVGMEVKMFQPLFTQRGSEQSMTSFLLVREKRQQRLWLAGAPSNSRTEAAHTLTCSTSMKTQHIHVCVCAGMCVGVCPGGTSQIIGSSCCCFRRTVTINLITLQP